MNIYEKLQNMRCELQKMSLKKTGKNTFAKYNYYELQDIVPAINNLLFKHHVTSIITYNSDTASLILASWEEPKDNLLFTSPMSTASLKGCHEVQNLGAVQTYLRRYLYMTAFEIVEHSAVETTQVKYITEEQVGIIYDLLNSKDVDEVKFLGYMKIDSVEKMPASKLKQALVALDRKVSKEKVGAK